MNAPVYEYMVQYDEHEHGWTANYREFKERRRWYNWNDWHLVEYIYYREKESAVTACKRDAFERQQTRARHIRQLAEKSPEYLGVL